MTNTTVPPTDKPTLSVTALTARIKERLEQDFNTLRVSGEVSRLSRAASGHLYFTIKDAHAAISACVWRSTVGRLSLQPKEGEAFIFSGHISVYEPRGSYQLIVTNVEAVGIGQLAAELERRKQLFAKRGWFDAARKRPIPALPKHIGIVTSATAAALQDVRKVLTSRPAWLRLTLSPCVVQGDAAPAAIAGAIQALQHCDIDVILLVRGGGSLEDLWCFNDQTVVQAVVNSAIPIISGVGHEIDSTLVDFAADLRAATPSNAAELCCPSRETLRQRIPVMGQWQTLLSRQIMQSHQRVATLQARIQQRVEHQHDDRHHRLIRWQQSLQHHAQQRLQQHRRLLQQRVQQLQQYEPGIRLRRQRQQCHAMRLRLLPPMQQAWQQRQTDFKQQQQRLLAYPLRATPYRRQAWSKQQQTLITAAKQQCRQARQHWQRLHDQLHSMNPTLVLRRGYTLVQDQQGHIYSSVQQLHTGQSITVCFHDGAAGAHIEAIDKQ
jgi:exodeoxyribonuclease VII large subunit